MILISSLIANLVMVHIECEVIKSLTVKPVFFNKYVDDNIICILVDKIEEILHELNKYHYKLKVTIEKDKNNTINFLDISIS